MSIDESLATDPFGRFLIKKANEWREIGALAERERIIKLLEDNFYPLDYPRWQADELMEEILRLIKGEEE